MSNAHGIADAPPWTGGPSDWMISQNSGTSYFAYNGVSTAQIVGPTGTQRFQKTFTPTAPGNVQFRFNGDLYDTPANVPPQVYLNGQFVGVGTTASVVAVTTLDLPIVAGVNVLEIWVGQSITPGGNMFLSNAIFDGGLVPCDCCPTGNTACVAVTAAPAFGSNFVAPPVAVPGGTAPGGSFVYTNIYGSGVDVTFTSDNAARPLSISGPNLLTIGGGGQALYTATFSVPVYLRSLDINDLDANSEWLFDTHPPVSQVQSGSPALRAPCPAFSPLGDPNGCFRGTVNNTTARFLWNAAGPTTVLTFRLGGPGGLGEFITGLAFDLAPPVVRRAYACIQGTDVQWYDDDGFLIPDAQIVPCPAPVSSNPYIPATLVMNGVAFGDAPGAGNEPLCSVSPAPISTTGLAAPVGQCRAPTAASVTLTWNNVGAIQMNYGNPPAVQSGGVLVNFTADGTTITWATNLVNMAVGETRLSNIFGAGHQARLTNLGPADASNAGNGSLRMDVGSIGLHRNATGAGGLPIGFKLDFVS